MQPVRTKKKTGLRRPALLLILLALLIAVGAALYFLLRPAQTEAPADENQASSLTLLDHDEGLISRITVHPSRTEAYTLVVSEGKAVLENDPDYPLREQTVQVLLYNASHLTADELVAESGKSHAGRIEMSDYGLDQPACSVDVTLTTGEEYTILLGNAAPMDEIRYYAAVSGRGNVYTVTSDVMDALNVQFTTLHPVPALAIDAELIDRIAVEDEEGKAEFAIERTSAGWMLSAPFRYPVAADKVESLLSSLEKLRFATWAGEDTERNRHKLRLEGTMQRLSLDFAPSVLTVTDEEGRDQTFEIPASNITILLGRAYSETADYYIYNGDILVGTTVTFSAVRRLSWQNYASPNPFVYEQNNLSEVTVVSEGTEKKYQIRYVERVLPNNQFETDEYGNTVYEMRVRKNGQDVDAYAFSEYYAQLMALDGALTRTQSSEEGAVWHPSSKDVPVVTVSVTPEDGTGTITTALYSGAMGRLYLTVDGTSVYTVPQAWADALLACP